MFAITKYHLNNLNKAELLTIKYALDKVIIEENDSEIIEIARELVDNINKYVK